MDTYSTKYIQVRCDDGNGSRYLVCVTGNGQSTFHYTATAPSDWTYADGRPTNVGSAVTSIPPFTPSDMDDGWHFFKGMSYYRIPYGSSYDDRTEYTTPVLVGSDWAIDQAAMKSFLDNRSSGYTYVLYSMWGSARHTVTLSKTNLSGGPSSLYYDTRDGGRFFADSGRAEELPAVDYVQSGLHVIAYGPIIKPSKECYRFSGFFASANNTGTEYITDDGYVMPALKDALDALAENSGMTIRAAGTEVSKKLMLSASNATTAGTAAIYNSLADRSKWYADDLCEGDPITSITPPGRISVNASTGAVTAGYVFNGFKYSSKVYINPNGTLGTDLYNDSTTFTSRSATVAWLNTKIVTISPGGGTGGDARIFYCADAADKYYRAVDGRLVKSSTFVPPTRECFTFAGCRTSDDDVSTEVVAADGTVSSSLAPTANVTIYARWTRLSWRISFAGGELPDVFCRASGGGTYRDAECTEAIAQGDALAEQTPLLEGHVFIGVFAADSASSTKYATAECEATAAFAALAVGEDTTVHCVFGVLYRISFLPEGGTGGPDPIWYLDSALYADSIGTVEATWPLSPMPTLTCWRFDGYFDDLGDVKYVDADGEKTGDLDDLVGRGLSEDLELHAQWTQLTVPVTLDDAGGTGGAGTIYATVGGSTDWTGDAAGENVISSVSVPVREGYTFLGYYRENVQAVNADGGFVAPASYAGGEPMTLHAVWSANTYTITFDTGLGTSTTKQVTMGASVGTLPASPAASGREFDGWYLDLDKITSSTVWIWPGDATVRARWRTGFGDVVDWFGLGSERLIPFESDEGTNRPRVVTRHYGKAAGAEQTGPVWRNPYVKYMVVGDMTLSVTLGKAYAKNTGTINGPYVSNGTWHFGNHSGMTETGYMITEVTIDTRRAFPVVTVSSVANEGSDAINKFAVSVAISARARPQNLLGGVSGGGQLQTVSLRAVCDPVVLAEGAEPCASDVVNGRYELRAETLAANREAAPVAAGGFAATGFPAACGGTEFNRHRLMATKEIT